MDGWMDGYFPLIIKLNFERTDRHLEMVGRAGGTSVHLGPVSG